MRNSAKRLEELCHPRNIRSFKIEGEWLPGMYPNDLIEDMS